MRQSWVSLCGKIENNSYQMADLSEKQERHRRKSMALLNNMIITEITEVSLRSHMRGEHYLIQKRPTYGLSFCTAGQITYTQNNKKTVSRENCAVIFPKDGHYHMQCNRDGRFPLVNFQCSDTFMTREFISIPLKNPEGYLKLYERLHTLFPLENNRAKCMQLLYEIIVMLCEEDAVRTNPLAPTMKYLETHFPDPALTNQLLSEHARLSEVYFRQLFKQIYNTSPKQYILDLRLQKAKQLLSDRSIPVAAVSEQCGFSNIYHFCRSFKGHTGMTPSEYRQKNLQYE